MNFTPEQIRKYFESRLPGQRLEPRRNVRCPFHDDRTASLSLNLDKGLFNCHANCGSGGLVDFEMEIARCDRDTAWARINDLLGIKQGRLSGRKIVAVYQYHDSAGRLLFEKVRYEPKEFSQRVPDGRGGYSYKLDGIKKPLYRLPQLLISNQIAICEGEKDADRLQATFGEQHPHFCATTTFDGAGKWKDDYEPYFAGKQVTVFADNDTQGVAHAETVVQSVVKHASSVKLIRFSDVPEHGDVSDYLDKHKPEDLQKLIADTPRWIDKRESAKEQTLFVPASEFISTIPGRIDWLVEGVIQAGANGFFVAQPKGGKSWAAIDLAISLARGIPWMDFKVTRNIRTALVSREDNPALTAWRLRHLNAAKSGGNGEYVDNLYVNSRQQSPELMLDNTEQLVELMGAMEQFKPEFVIFDVFNVMHAADENDNSEMRAVLKQLSLIQAKTGCAIGVVHHFNKGEGSITQRIRGASAIAGWAEWIIAISMADDAEKIRKMEFELKAAEAPESVYYQILSGTYTAKLMRCAKPAEKTRTSKKTYEVIGAGA
jgi:putative DNA primase/helicase